MTNQEKKNLAFSLYVRGNLSRKDIAIAAHCTEKTLRAWVEKGDWDTVREAHTVTRQQLLADSFKQLKAVNMKIEGLGGVPNKELSDAKSILRKEIEVLSSSPLHLYVEVFDELTAWLMKCYPKEAPGISKKLLEFIDERNKAAG